MRHDRFEDPRDNLARARRMELYRFARENGVNEIVETMPAELMRHILRQRNVTHIQPPPRLLGMNRQENTSPTSHRYTGPMPMAEPDKVVETNAIADLARQWAQQQAYVPPPIEAPATSVPPTNEKPFAQMNINELRWACKARGIKLDRRDRMPDLRRKLENTP